MDIYIDIETLRSPESHMLEILEDVKANFKAPHSLSKAQASADLGLTDKDEIKYTSKDDMIARWEKELAGEKSESVANEIWEKTSFNPDVAPIACICIGYYDQYTNEYKKLAFSTGENKHLTSMGVENYETEAMMLWSFHHILGQFKDANGTDAYKLNFIGHNIGKFDLPFIWKRSVINNVKTCKGVKWVDGRHGQHFYDTMIAWAGFGNRISADNLAKLLGIKGKSDMDGSKVYDTWQEDPQKVIDYCHDDVELVKNIHERLIK